MTLDDVVREYLRTDDHEKFLAALRALRPQPSEQQVWDAYYRVSATINP